MKTVDVNLDRQMVEVPGTRRPGQTGIFRLPQATENLVPNDGSGVRTLYENFEQGKLFMRHFSFPLSKDYLTGTNPSLLSLSLLSLLI